MFLIYLSFTIFRDIRNSRRKAKIIQSAEEQRMVRVTEERIDEEKSREVENIIVEEAKDLPNEESKGILSRYIYIYI